MIGALSKLSPYVLEFFNFQCKHPFSRNSSEWSTSPNGLQVRMVYKSDWSFHFEAVPLMIFDHQPSCWPSFDLPDGRYPADRGRFLSVLNLIYIMIYCLQLMVCCLQLRKNHLHMTIIKFIFFAFIHRSCSLSSINTPFNLPSKYLVFHCRRTRIFCPMFRNNLQMFLHNLIFAPLYLRSKISKNPLQQTPCSPNFGSLCS